MTVEVFDSLASSQGLQKSGWFAKIVKDKFNIKLNIIAPNVSGGDTVFDTRSASGNLGDLVIVGTGNGRLNKLVKAKLIEDMTPYYSSMKNVKKYDSAVKSIAKQAGKDGVWGVPQGVSSQSPTDPSEGNESAAAPYIRWDIYKEIGYPQIKDLDGLLNVLKQMQDRARQDTGKDDIYAMSLFKDRDGDVMQNAASICSWFGYTNQGSVFISADGKDVQPATKEGGIYQQALEFLNKAESMGLVDPDSTTQDWDTMRTKVTNGKTMLSIWSWLGKPRMNSDENKAKGVGFMLAPLENMKVYSDGFQPDGDGRHHRGHRLQGQEQGPSGQVHRLDVFSGRHLRLFLQLRWRRLPEGSGLLHHRQGRQEPDPDQVRPAGHDRRPRQPEGLRQAWRLQLR